MKSKKERKIEVLLRTLRKEERLGDNRENSEYNQSISLIQKLEGSVDDSDTATYLIGQINKKILGSFSQSERDGIKNALDDLQNIFMTGSHFNHFLSPTLTNILKGVYKWKNEIYHNHPATALNFIFS